MTSLVNFSGLWDYEEFRITDREHIILMLQELQREQTPVYLFFSDERPVASKIIEVAAEQGDVVLAFTNEMSRIQRLNASGIFVVADHAHTQLQYHVDALAQRLGGAGSDFFLPLPDSLYLIQRRASLRRQIPEADQVVCLIKGDDGQAREFPVLDISDEGLALLDADCLLPAEAGDVMGGVTLKLPGSEIGLNLTLANRFSIYLPEQNRRVVRVGCTTAGLGEADRDTLEHYLKQLNSL
jgi:hypothetical protein